MAEPRTPDAYEIADTAIRQLNRRTVQMFAYYRNQMQIADFDELNVISDCNALYAELDRSARKKYRELFALRYLEVFEWLIALAVTDAVLPGEDTVEALAEMAISGLLSEPNPVTRYAWDAEILRKRDKVAEAVNSVSGKGNKQEELAKHQRYIAAQMGYYADFASQEAEMQAMKDAGVQRVQRHERNDNKVCRVCKALDGKIYRIDQIEPPEHPHCRRFFTPA